MELKFNSQICTTREQSQRLLDLGLKPETADMSLTVVCGAEIAQWVGELNNLGNIKVNGISVPNEEVENIPAWSLHRLIELYSDVEDTSFLCIKDVSYKLLIFCIEKAIHCGAFNKEYLNE
ncbi:MAG: hypothetical protein IKV17_07735 [Bacteroidaceae bacterium]|nr:hypothetical protein [Bacteroidaceae bacterium]